MGKDVELFKVLTGSRLYGTNTTNSDYDYKVVILPDLGTLLLNTKVSIVKVKPEGKSSRAKMLAAETETEYIPVQVFLDDFYAGQTYALELAFAVAQGLAEVRDPFMQGMAQSLIDNFLTSNVKKMVGYAVAQSKLYGLKTERFKTVKDAVKIINEYFERTQTLDVNLNDCYDLRCELANLPYVKPVMIENSMGGSELAPALEICSKKFALTNKVSTMYKSLKNTLDSYGVRVASFEGEGVDWKALSHAIRITTQVLELSRTGKITFPNVHATLLREIKNGEVPLDEASLYLELLFNQIDGAIENSVLRERTPELDEKFKEWKLVLLRGLYLH